MFRAFVTLFFLSGVLSCSCDKAIVRGDSPPKAEMQAQRKCVVEENGHVIRNFSGPVFAIGDLHGDLEQTKRALRLTGAIDANNKWIGTCMIVVQTGDQVDRGDEDREVIDFLRSLSADALKNDSRLIVLNGNHELMNARLDFRYTTPKANERFSEFQDYEPLNDRIFFTEQGRLSLGDVLGNETLEHFAYRGAAFVPGRLYARYLAERSFYAIVNDSVFVHGGISPEHIDYGLEKFNEELRAFFMKGIEPNEKMLGGKGPFWLRDFSSPADQEPGPVHCETASQALLRLDAKRMVVGHTIQSSINSACEGKVWRIDIGMSKAYGNRAVQVLEINANEAHIRP